MSLQEARPPIHNIDEPDIPRSLEDQLTKGLKLESKPEETETISKAQHKASIMIVLYM